MLNITDPKSEQCMYLNMNKETSDNCGGGGAEMGGKEG